MSAQAGQPLNVSLIRGPPGLLLSQLALYGYCVIENDAMEIAADAAKVLAE